MEGVNNWLKNLKPHSYLNAFIGSYSDAFLAGYTPKNIPTAAENKKATTTDHRARCVGRNSTK